MFQLVILPAGNCSLEVASNFSDSSNQHRPQLIAFKATFVVLGSINLALNSLSMLVFLCHRQKESIIRLLLLLLSSTEAVASFSMSSVEASRLMLEVAQDSVIYGSEDSARCLVQFLSVTWAMANTALVARNWCIVLIAVSRCEAVVRPFSRNTGRCCGHRTVSATFAGIILVALVFGLPKAFQEEYHYCPSNGRIVGKDLMPPFNFYAEFYLTSVFFQAVLPIVIVSTASAAMTIGLREHRRRVGVGSSQTHCKATRMIQLLLAVFVCMEMPMFLTVLIGIKAPGGNKAWDTFMLYAVEISNLCINLDSTCNFAVYMKANRVFRSVVLRRTARPRININSTNNINNNNAVILNGSSFIEDRQPSQYMAANLFVRGSQISSCRQGFSRV